ncbi:hypothetical protein [Bowmanella denitrificans]|uniref:hypothetical protein n=1 Tax=Bowmanella denitrificans TaxID=366582 RepID=UPI000C99F2D6|nr:hypothetical protein [Bowmanella denitrificans]
MTDSHCVKDAKSNAIARMEGLQMAIANGEVDRVRQLLANQVLDKLQKSYLLDLAELNQKAEIVKLLEKTPVKH